MSEPTAISDSLSWRAPACLHPSELDEVCRACGRRRGDHFGARGTSCPDGVGWNPASTFEASGRSETPSWVVEARLVVHALKRSRRPCYAAQRGMRTNDEGGSVDNCVIGWVLTNRRELEG